MSFLMEGKGFLGFIQYHHYSNYPISHQYFLSLKCCRLFTSAVYNQVRFRQDFIMKANSINPDQTARPGPEVTKLFSYSTQLSTEFILLINVKMPTIVNILTIISMINTTSKRLKTRNSSIVGILVLTSS